MTRSRQSAHILGLTAAVLAVQATAALASPPSRPSSFAAGCTIPDKYPTADFAGDIASGDFDGVNGPDLAVGADTLGLISVLLNNGDGTFAPVAAYPVGGSATQRQEIVVADFDRANGPDIAAVNEGGYISVLLNNGDGTFAADLRFATKIEANALVTADFDGINGTDLAVGFDRAPGGVTVHLNDGTGGFGAMAVYDGGGGLLAPTLVAVDLDSSNGPDLVWAHYSGFELGTIVIRRNDGAGNFGPLTEIGDAGYYPSELAAIDIDGVNGPDLAYVEHELGIEIWVNDGAGGLVWTDNLYNTDGFALPRDVDVADLDCTFGQDILVTLGNSHVGVFLSDGVGGFAPNVLYDGHGASNGSVVADFDGLNGPDWAVSDWYGFADVSLNCVGLSCLTGTWLLRHDAITSIAPVTPAFADIFKTGSLLIEDGLTPDFVSGTSDPDAGIVDDATRPLVLYQVTAPGDGLRLVKTVDRRVALSF